MTAYEIVDLILAAQNRGDVQWGLFITVHVALFGGIVYVDRPLRTHEKITGFAIYLGFAWINYRLLRDILRLLEDLHVDLVALASDPCCRQSAVIERAVVDLAGGRFEDTGMLLIASHLLMALIVALSIIFDRELTASIRS